MSELYNAVNEIFYFDKDLLTIMSLKNLQKFIAKYAEDIRSFGVETVFFRCFCPLKMFPY